DDPGCTPPVCEYDPELPPDDPGCTPPVCEYDPELPPDDPECTPPVCEYDPELPPDDPECTPPVCEYDPELPPDDPECTPPVCEYDPELPPDDPECTPDFVVSALCREYSLSSTGADSTVGYWYDVTNPQAGPVTITYYDSVGPLSITLAGGQSTRIRVDSTDPQFLVEGSEIATPVPGEDCELELIVTKELNGPPPGEALYTVDIAYYDDGVESLVLTFELSSEEPEAITLPASYGDPGDDGAIEYIVREVGENQGTIVSYSPSDRFFGSGNVGEQVSVVITNSYAAVEIDKTVNDDRVEPGQTIFYELIVSNTGGLALENLAIDDLFPATILFVDYEVVGEGLPISCTEVPTPDGPDYLTCDATGVLEPGQTLPTIRVTAEVGPGASSVDHFDNQSRVIGDFIVSDDSPSGPAGFSRGAFGQSRGVSVEVSPVRVLAAPPPPGENLSCAPVEGQVCNVSPVVLAVGQVPGSTTTTTVVGGGGELPETGSDVTDELVLLAMGLLVAGSAALVVSRRRITA
ncbi:LPXTG cell wall anchor domain-containing protein, partial [Desertimonas flava]|uniref:LPXTG cell wall anchor domain-containing protein n=1 Tax=Desertimonas flava TaxID=2064846 RepID=UPI000E35397A